MKLYIDSNFNQAVIYKISFFHEMIPYHKKKIVILKVQLEINRTTASTL